MHNLSLHFFNKIICSVKVDDFDLSDCFLQTLANDPRLKLCLVDYEIATGMSKAGLKNENTYAFFILPLTTSIIGGTNDKMMIAKITIGKLFSTTGIPPK